MSIASASTTVKFHEFPTGNVVHNYQPGTQVDGPIRSISWSKDGNWLALVPYSGSAEIVSVKDQLKLIHTIQGIEEPSCASFQNTTKKNIAVGTKSGQVLIYDIKARNIKKRYPRATSVVTKVEFTAKDNHVVAACESGEAYIFSNVTNNLSGTFRIPRSQSISALRTNPLKRNYVVAGSNEGVVAVWDIHGNKHKFFIGSHKAAVTAVAFSPINSDLVVSTGLDRQFCYYDIAANKCIGNIFVENSMASVDFSPDGKFIVMASQMGKIYIYDSKNFQQPIHSFFGHSSPIEHLSFRKTDDYESSFNISYDSATEPKTNVNAEQDNESFPLSLISANDQTNEVSKASGEGPDSFMAAIGLDQNNTTQSVKQEHSFKATEGSKKFVPYKYTPTNPGKILQEKIFSESKTQFTSTPNFFNQEICPPISPIINPDAQSDVNSNRSFKNLQEFIKDTVKEEIKTVAEELKSDMKYYSTHNLSQTRQMCLDLLMSMVKEFIKIENNFNSLRADLVCDLPQNQGSLFQENVMLKQKIAVLEEELSMLRNNEVNKNTF